MQRAGSALKGLLAEMGMESSLGLERIKEQWKGLFPGPLSSHSSPVSLSDGVLTLTVDSSAWLQQLNFLKGDLRRKLDGFAVREIRLRLGRVSGG